MPSKISTSRTSEIRLLRPVRFGVDFGVRNCRSLRYVCGENDVYLFSYCRCVDLSSATFELQFWFRGWFVEVWLVRCRGPEVGFCL